MSGEEKGRRSLEELRGGEVRKRSCLGGKGYTRGRDKEEKKGFGGMG